MKSIEQICADYHGFPVEKIYEPDRRIPYSEARQQAIFFYRKYTPLCTEKIGRILKRDHATVIYATKLVDSWLAPNFNFCYDRKMNTIEIEKLILAEGYVSKSEKKKAYAEMNLKSLFYEILRTIRDEKTKLSKGNENELPMMITAFEDKMIKTGIEW